MDSRALRRASLLVASAILIAACATSGGKLSPDSVSRIQVGETTQAQVRQMFGNPTDIDRRSGRPEVWVYRTGGGSGVDFGDLVGAVPVKSPVSLPSGGSSSSSATMLKIEFDMDGRVADYQYKRQGGR